MRQERFSRTSLRDSMRSRSKQSPPSDPDNVGTPDIIASVDVGSTYSGYAFAITKDLDEDRHSIHVNKEWISGNAKLITYKAPSCVLFTPEKRLHSFGYEAEYKYGQLALDKVHTSWYYFRRFKIPVLEDETLSTATNIKDDSGKPLRAAAVFCGILKYLRSHLIDALAGILKVSNSDWIVEKFHIRWVLTHPATWTDNGQHFLKVAAKQAGIADVILVPEPVAASFYCQIMPLHRINTRNGEIICLQRTGMQYLLLDLGGGTVDSTVMELDENNELKQKQRSCGAVFGGIRVDGAFVEFLMKLIGFDIMDKFFLTCKQELLNLQKDFEIKKRTFNPANGQSIVIKLPPMVRKIYEVNYKQQLQLKVENSEYGELVKLVGDNLHIDVEIVESFYTVVAEQITSHLVKILYAGTAKDIKTLVLAGGFANSVIVQNAIRKKFPDITILMPTDPELSVMQGGVLYGYESNPILYMKAKYSYGTAIAMPYNVHEHNDDKKFSADGVPLCADLFHRYIEVGEEIRIGEFVRTGAIFINRKDQRYLSVPIYLSTVASPLYTSDNACHYLGRIRITLVSNRKENSQITIKMALTYTELIVEVTDEGSGRTVRDVFLDSPVD
ncbi:heat shock 70 kDa protein 12B-like [Mytilus californianus]|uniref:heat shock 70 kDa protein 12B-like n=1 Tax=Mytilus californianus TaxID=6549 RepID=UPI0022458FB5|nr:heat shock 70 kDa protein 12B-like [Mytilus californianus]